MHLVKLLSALALIPLTTAMPPSQVLAMFWGDKHHDHHDGDHHNGHHGGRHGCPDKPQECNHHCRRRHFDRGVCVSPKKSNGKANYCSCEDDSMWSGRY
ncbi:uncharacterized protein ACLA_098740 [Aspergillus clavatus NRRL 1]|uniref:Uncharacterized protein n=1 Tax=Aspergillus clavatus (strain ATCC 1007 / CBS 513.65 / DSM 816 / NCTC 3887 / NRRL 1 / QM 1276 / 107) TaxID=344612 RepID=A1CMZ5_ASPCL|nr:uncharacterized protein ACLA_098740 [Aspergillus clavatus NRRL 1]EAW08932.1 hypothetical protein ACLA_098740 [Aspergillus clavatus NRRL 1]